VTIGTRSDLAELTLYLAGSVGQASLDRLADHAHPELGQHMAAVTEAVTAVLGRHADDPEQMLGGLVRYPCGFAEAAIQGGWQPTTPDAPDDAPPDWESMRLAAICHLVSQLRSAAD
jgi:hypothetical protein